MTTTSAGDSASALTVSRALAKMLRAYGAEYVFTLTGAPQDALIDMQNHEGIRVVLGRSERSAFAMADAYARLTGKPTFGIVQFGPGATYLPASIIDAYWASSPLIAISGSTTTNTRYRYEYQELDQTSMFPAITKWAGDLPQPERIADVVRTAVRAAMGGVPGPAYLGIPADWFGKRLATAPDIYAEPAFLRVPAARVAPVAQDVERAIALLAGAEKPVLIAGGGVMLSEAWAELTALAEALNIPVVTTMAGKGSIADTHPLAVGACGRYSRKVANETLANADFCLAIGTKLSSMGTNIFQYPRKGTRIVHVDLDPNSLGRTYREELSIVADAREALKMLRQAATAARVNGSKWAAWTKQVQGSVAAWIDDLDRASREPMHEGKLNPYHVMRLIDQHLRGDDVLVADTGYMAAWAVTVLQQKQAGRNTLRAAGSLGWAFPAAFGAKLAAGAKRRVFGLTGDGGAGYHLPDLETALRLKLPAVQIVMNNCSLAFEYHVQKYVHKEMCPEASEFLDVPFGDVARAFGAHGERVTSAEQFIPALRRAEESGKPAIVDVVVSRELPPPVTRYEAAGLRKI
ncbi:MAG TPA: thiamine pyrophosphate-binding protein [Candidatus Acidoferrales bacterium]|nr:thiamine pyrophosphate-binding protein [Candidatus Acidoferrales bacterium]